VLLFLARRSPKICKPSDLSGHRLWDQRSGSLVFSEFLASALASIHLPGSTSSLQRWIYHPLASVISNPSVAALTYAILYVGVCFIPVALLYRRKILLKV
jgi:predicted acyltransferase